MIIMVIMVGSMIMTMMMMMTQMTMLVRVMMMTMMKMEIGPRAEMSCSLAVPDPGGSDSRPGSPLSGSHTHNRDESHPDLLGRQRAAPDLLTHSLTPSLREQ